MGRYTIRKSRTGEFLVADAALTALNEIIDASEMLIKLLDASIVDGTDTPSTSEQVQNTNNKLLALMKKREQKIHFLFDEFNTEKLQVHLEKIQSMTILDKQLIDKVNSTQRKAKSNILALKKNRKAIHTYQKN